MTAGASPAPAKDQRPLGLLDRDADLTHAVPEPDRALARRTLVVPSVTFAPGPVDLDDAGLPQDTFALLVVDGELTSDVVLDGRSLTELLLPGDVECRWGPEAAGLPATRELVARTPALLAILESRFLLAAARWPRLMVTIQRRMSEQKHRLAIHGAICQFPRVEDRLLAMLRHIAERSGRVTAEGTVIAGTLTHEALGRLVGARRPTVSLALKGLTGDGRIRRRPDGTWILLG